ncbi:MAG: serine/threonine-protein kinase, partial [Gemmataceae bacterium]
MEYLRGMTLEEVLQRRGRLPVPEAVEVIRQALAGLAHLHEHGMVHRNLEPANLMLQGSDGAGSTAGVTVKLLDFSLVRDRTAGAQPGAGSSKGDEALALMAPQYRAAELACDPFTADIRADIYTLGGVLYHALTGRPPFADPTPVGQMIRHATEAPPPVREAAPDVPESLEHILTRMMARSPQRRYPTPEQASRALVGFLAGGPGEAEPAAVEGVFVEADASSGWEPMPGTISVELVLPPSPADSAGEPVVVPPEPDPGGGLTGRDGWLLVLGGLGVLLAQLIGWLAALLGALRAGR